MGSLKNSTAFSSERLSAGWYFLIMAVHRGAWLEQLREGVDFSSLLDV
jgi:hypothetical protein